MQQLNAIILYLCQNFRMTREQLIEKNKALFWYTPEAEKQKISDALLVETFLNYGTLDDYRDLISVLGGKHTWVVSDSL